MATKSIKGKEKQKASAVETKEVLPKETSTRSKWLIILGIIALTFIAYLPGFSPEKEFTNWDDLGYVVEQPLVKTSNPDSLKLLFEPTTQVMLNYHPLTTNKELSWITKNSQTLLTNGLKTVDRLDNLCYTINIVNNKESDDV